MKLTTIQVSNAIFETLRLLLVQAGHLPDYTTFSGTQPQITAAFDAAKAAINNGGIKEVIDLYGIGNYKSRGERKYNTIYINLVGKPASKAGTGKQYEYEDNDAGGYTKKQTPTTRYDLQYQISYVSDSETYGEIIENFLLQAFTSRKELIAIDDNFTSITGGEFWLIQKGHFDTSGTTFIERGWRYDAINIDLQGWKDVGTVAQITQIDIGILPTTTPTTNNPNTDDVINIDVEF